jgi:ribose transport system ATP-binding protein
VATPLLEVRGLSKGFPGVQALQAVDFDVRQGEVHVLLGENGAGKSTPVKILTGAQHKDAGEIRWRGQQVDIDDPHRAQKLGISVIYQEFNLVPYMTVAENMFLGREPVSQGLLDRRRMLRAAQAILDDLGVSVRATTRVADLGVAEQQMTEIAKALSLDAELLIMDEPTATLTEREIERLFDAIRRLRERRVSVIYISHRLNEVKQVGDRVTVLRDGRKVATLEAADAAVHQLIRLMVGHDLREQYPKQHVERGPEVLRVEGLSRDGVLHDISFSLHRGEILGLAGLVGAGRTELARAIFGADPISAGRIFVDGRPVSIRSPAEAIRLGIGLVPEDRKGQGLVLDASVEENLGLVTLRKATRAGIVDLKGQHVAAERIAGQLGVRMAGLGQHVRTLSGGNQQKVVIGKWLLADTKVLILDEPTRGIDVGAKVEIYELVNELTAAGAAVLMISSDLPEVLGMSDRVLVMAQGRIAGELAADEATQDAVMALAVSTPTPQQTETKTETKTAPKTGTEASRGH